MQVQNVYTDTGITAGAVPVNAVETVAIFLPPNITLDPGRLVIVEFDAAFTTGATTTAVVARIRRGNTVGGALVGAAHTVQIGAALATSIGGQVGDIPGEVAGAQYCLTLQQTGGTANGTALFASLQATWLVP